MTEPRFTVERASVSPGPGMPAVRGWAVFDRGKRISISFPDYAEAMQHRDTLAAHYREQGW